MTGIFSMHIFYLRQKITALMLNSITHWSCFSLVQHKMAFWQGRNIALINTSELFAMENKWWWQCFQQKWLDHLTDVQLLFTWNPLAFKVHVWIFFKYYQDHPYFVSVFLSLKKLNIITEFCCTSQQFSYILPDMTCCGCFLITIMRNCK